MSTLQDPRVDEDQLLDQGWDIPCDYDDGRPNWECSGTPARWVGHVRCPECSHRDQRLLCTPCKDIVTNTEHGCWCPNCESRIVPFRRAFVLFEPLERSA